MLHESESHNQTPTSWGSNGSGGDVTVDSLYELREVLQSIGSIVELSPKHDGGIRWANSNGGVSLFEFGDTAYEYPASFFTTANSHFNRDFSGPWESPQGIIVDQWNAGDIYNQLLKRSWDEDIYDLDVVLGFDLTSTNAELITGQNISATYDRSTGWDGGNSSLAEFERQDTYIRLSDSFWDNLISVRDSDLDDTSQTQLSINPDFNNKTIDFDSLSASSYEELIKQINREIDLNFSSDSPLYTVEFSGHAHGEARFRHAPSGAELRLQITDNDDSQWGSFSGVGAIDVDYNSDDGSHYETKIEFGLVNHSVEEFLRSISQAYEFQQNSPIPYDSASGIEPFESPSLQKWDLEQIDVWSNGTSPFPGDDIGSLFRTAIENQDISFKTNFSGLNISDPYSPIKLEISEYSDNTFDIESGIAGFDLNLNGPVQTDALNKPHTSNFHANLNYQAYLSNTDIIASDLGSINIYMNSSADGLWNEHNNFNAGNLRNLYERYPEYADSDSTIDFYLRDVNIGSNTFETREHSNISFWRNNVGEAFNESSSSGIFTGLTIEDVFPNMESVETISVLNAFKSFNDYPLAAQFALIDNNNISGDDALAFRYEFSDDIEGALSQNAVLGDSVDHYKSYNLNIFAESLESNYRLESTDITINFNPLLFENIHQENIIISGEVPVANAVSIDNETGTIRIAAASLSDITGYDPYTGITDRDLGNGIGPDEQKLATIQLNFSESQIQGLEKNPDGSLKISPLSFSIEANQDETVFSRDFTDEDTGLLNREIVTLNDLGGGVDVDGQDVTLYEAKINFEQLGDGLVLGTDRVIGADASFTNLIRSGDTLSTSVDWLNVGNIDAHNLSYTEVYNQNATLQSAEFTQTSVASGSFIDGVFVEDGRESTTLTTDIKVTGEAGNVLDLSDGIVSIQADGSETFSNAGQGSSNLITYQGDLNYDGRVSMKDLAYLNAGAARQQEAVNGTSGDADNNGILDASVARDVDADFNGKIDLADLSILDADWGKTLHTGDRQFQGSNDVSWSQLDDQGIYSTWDNDSFKDQNETETEANYVGSLESPTATNVIGADGNTDANDADSTGTYFQEII